MKTKDTSDKDVLIDGGRPSAGSAVVSYLESLSITRVHLMIATHVHEDHIGGLVSVLESTVDVDEVLLNNQTYSINIYTTFLSWAQNHTLIVAQRGSVLVLRNKVTIWLSSFTAAISTVNFVKMLRISD